MTHPETPTLSSENSEKTFKEKAFNWTANALLLAILTGTGYLFYTSLIS